MLERCQNAAADYRRDDRRHRHDHRRPRAADAAGRRRRDASGDEQVGGADAAARDAVPARGRRAAGDARLCGRRPGRRDLERVVRDRRHDRRALQHADAGRHRQRIRRSPHPSRGRRRPEGAPQAGAGGARVALQRHPSREHAEAVADGRRSSARRCPPSTRGRRPSTRSSTGRPRGCSTRSASTRELAHRWDGEMEAGVEP